MFTQVQFQEAANQLHDEMGMVAFIMFCKLNAELIEEAIKKAAQPSELQNSISICERIAQEFRI